MADWSKPALASTYANFVTETNARDTDLAVMFDPAVTTPTNFPTSAVRWRSAANKWEKWNGSAWSDLSSLYAINISGTSANVTGVVAAANGGTGQSSYAVGDLLYASGASALSKLAAVATGNVLLSGGAATAPTWGKVGLTTHVSGVLPVANGGTGVATLTGVPYWNGTSAPTAATAAQLVAAIGATAVANATNATTAANGGVTSVNGATGAVTIQVQAFDPGTAVVFAQAAAPTGWTKSTTHNDKSLRVVSGSGGGSGGVQAFSTVFGRTAVDGSSLSIAQLAAHTHDMTGDNAQGYSSSSSSYSGGHNNNSGYNSGAVKTTSSTGSGATHTHGLDLRVAYVDVIICTKD